MPCACLGRRPGEAIVVGKGRRVSAEQWSNRVHMCKGNVFRPWAALPARAGGRAPLRCVSAHRAVGYAQHFGGLTACSLCPLRNTSLTLREIVSVTCYTTPGMCPDPQVAPFSTCGAAYSLTNSRAYAMVSQGGSWILRAYCVREGHKQGPRYDEACAPARF